MTHPSPIHLRRPAVLNMVEGTFVPEVAHRNGQRVGLNQREILEEVDRRWAALCAKNPNYFDGRLLHVLGVHRNGHGGATLHVIECAYRFHAVQTDDFDIGVRALGVKGVTMRMNPLAERRNPTADGLTHSPQPIAHSPAFLLGRRSHAVAAYQGMWEFAPAGSVEPGESPEDLVRRELREETGLEAVGQIVGGAVLYDPDLRCWELLFDLKVDREPSARTAEYSDFAWRTLDNLPVPLSPVAIQIAALLGRRESTS